MANAKQELYGPYNFSQKIFPPLGRNNSCQFTILSLAEKQRHSELVGRSRKRKETL